MKKWEVTLQLRGTTNQVVFSDLVARSPGEAVGHALAHLAMPASWQVHHVAEVVSV